MFSIIVVLLPKNQIINIKVEADPINGYYIPLFNSNLEVLYFSVWLWSSDYFLNHLSDLERLCYTAKAKEAEFLKN